MHRRREQGQAGEHSEPAWLCLCQTQGLCPGVRPSLAVEAAAQPFESAQNQPDCKPLGTKVPARSPAWSLPGLQCPTPPGQRGG